MFAGLVFFVGIIAKNQMEEEICVAKSFTLHLTFD